MNLALFAKKLKRCYTEIAGKDVQLLIIRPPLDAEGGLLENYSEKHTTAGSKSIEYEANNIIKFKKPD